MGLTRIVKYCILCGVVWHSFPNVTTLDITNLLLYFAIFLVNKEFEFEFDMLELTEKRSVESSKG